ncbi:hypothetical protein R1flu_006435 [Riccia fluitans]|uniref:Uncharacterized protein n=1 Tax=Riccia fluitans TaxID=41844 RepID=A0ABD1YWN3_9MARC
MGLRQGTTESRRMCCRFKVHVPWDQGTSIMGSGRRYCRVKAQVPWDWGTTGSGQGTAWLGQTPQDWGRARCLVGKSTM